MKKKQKDSERETDIALERALFARSGTAYLTIIKRQYATKESVTLLEWIHTPAYYADEAMQCMKAGDVDKAIWWAMRAATQHSEPTLVKGYLPFLAREINRREGQKKGKKTVEFHRNLENAIEAYRQLWNEQDDLGGLNGRKKSDYTLRCIAAKKNKISERSLRKYLAPFKS